MKEHTEEHRVNDEIPDDQGHRLLLQLVIAHMEQAHWSAKAEEYKHDETEAGKALHGVASCWADTWADVAAKSWDESERHVVAWMALACPEWSPGNTAEAIDAHDGGGS